MNRLLPLITILVMFVGLTSVSTMAAPPLDKPNTLTFAYEETNSFPWVFDHEGNAEGLDIELMRLLERDLKVRINLVKYPWKRCLAMMKSGDVDGVIGSSYKSDRLTMGSYPTRQGGSNESSQARDIDPAKRIHTSGYALYRLKGARIEWRGDRFLNAGKDSSVASQMGFTITEDLMKMGVSVMEVPDDPKMILRGLVQKHYAGAALQTTTASYLLGRNTEYRGRVERCSTDTQPFHQKPYYLMLSFQLTKKYPAFAVEIWKQIEKARESSAYKGKMKTFFKRFTK